MLELKGKYNTAKVFTDNVDNETISQVIELLNQDYIKDAKIRIMPDCHAGAGCVIGTTMTISDKVCPNLVGVDIGCGMLAVRIAEKDVDLPKLDDVINTYVPAGFNVNDEPLGNFSHLNDLVAPADISLAYCSIGSLGGGNHFIELDKDDDGNLWLVIHTGSRHLGLEVAKHYQELAYKQLKDLDVGDKIKAVIQRSHVPCGIDSHNNKSAQAKCDRNDKEHFFLSEKIDRFSLFFYSAVYFRIADADSIERIYEQSCYNKRRKHRNDDTKSQCLCKSFYRTASSKPQYCSRDQCCNISVKDCRHRFMKSCPKR